MLKKEYIGDGIYIEHAGYGTVINLTTENGIHVQDRIVIEEGEFERITNYVNRLKAALNPD